MCLGIPGRVVRLEPGFADQVALVDVEGAERRINVGMLDQPPAPGDVGAHPHGLRAGGHRRGGGPPGDVRARADGPAASRRPPTADPAPVRRVRAWSRASGSGRSSTARPPSSALDRVGGQHGRRGGRRGRGRRRTRSAAFGDRLRFEPPPLAMIAAVARGRACRSRAAPGSPSRSPATAAPVPHARLARRGHLRRLPGRAARPGRPPVPAPVHHLHQLRPPVHDHHRRCPTTGRPPRWPASRCARPAGPSTTTRPTGASTPSRSPATTAAPGSNWSHAARRSRRSTGRDRGDPRAAGRRAHRRRQGARRLPPRLRRRATTTAVAELRRRKRRGDKPFAVMVADLSVARVAGRPHRRGRRAAQQRPAADRAACRAEAGIRRPRRAAPTSG